MIQQETEAERLERARRIAERIGSELQHDLDTAPVVQRALEEARRGQDARG
jgi:hypothetical protein